MFGISFSKILLLVAVIAAVYFGFKYLTRKVDSGDEPKAKVGKKKRAPETGETDAVEEMLRCPHCGTFRARGAPACCEAARRG